MTIIRSTLAALIGFVFAVPVFAAPRAATRLLKQSDEWFASEEAKTAAANILTYQSPLGGWPKNIDLAAAPFAGTPDQLVDELKPVFDNGATTDEIRFMARMAYATNEPKYLESFRRGVDYILTAQYPTGGWPQSYPPDTLYHRHITFNDDAMVRIMGLLDELAKSPDDALLDDELRAKAKRAFAAGIDCILRCQVVVDGKLTAWCAQHDEIDYTPRSARRFELVSLSGAETVGIMRVLMSVDPPTPDIVRAVESAAIWLQQVKITGLREEIRDHNKVMIPDPSASALWARFYEIGTNRPIFADMESVVHYDLAEISAERRNGYDWHGRWPDRLFDQWLPEWRTKVTAEIQQAAAALSVDRPNWRPKPVIVLVGDSTVAADGGWGDAFGKRIVPTAECLNFARSGRSSKSFRAEKHWRKALDAKPNWVLIQFGHNDVPGKGPERETDPATTYRENLGTYIDEARQAGAQPVLVTSLTRRNFAGTKIKPDSLAPYVEAAKEVAGEKGVPLLDLNALSIAQAEAIGPAALAEFDHPSKDGKPDRTHLSPKGAESTAQLVADEVRKCIPELARLLANP